uniref:Uncharacterized protein n=1 Tax=Cacopsylla melanoneura TaxID=428564 RepID=A0A8D8Z459_9HEMI
MDENDNVVSLPGKKIKLGEKHSLQFASFIALLVPRRGSCNLLEKRKNVLCVLTCFACMRLHFDWLKFQLGLSKQYSYLLSNTFRKKIDAPCIHSTSRSFEQEIDVY